MDTMKKKYRFALLISSYSRIPDLLRQVYAMAYGQTYKNTHIFVSVKGIPESCYEEVIIPQLDPLITIGKVSCRLDGNSNQMWNFLDTVKGHDTSEYDVFFKIDDDDIYHPDYLKYCAEALALAPKHSSTYVSGNFSTYKNKEDTWVTVPTFSPGSYFIGWGNMLGMSRPIFEHIEEARDDVTILASDTKLFGWKDGLNMGWREDRYYFECMQHYGTAVDVAPLFESVGIAPSIIGGHTWVGSLTRNGDFVQSEFFSKVSNLRMTNGHPPYSYILETTSGKLLRIFDDKVTDIDTGEEKNSVLFNGVKLVLGDGIIYKKQENCKWKEEEEYVET